MRPDRWTLSAVVLLASLGVAAAQQTAPPNQSTNPLGDGPIKSQQGGKEEPGSHPATTTSNTDIFVDGKLVVPGAPADSQTVPSKVSERNAWLDAQPIMALPIGISDEQRKRILDALKDTPSTDKVSAKPADILPITTETAELPKEIRDSVPMVSDFRFIKTRDKVLLLRAPNMVVVGEIAAN